jgi:superfamily I DNA/RNA helicase
MSFTTILDNFLKNMPDNFNGNLTIKMIQDNKYYKQIQTYVNFNKMKKQEMIDTIKGMKNYHLLNLIKPDAEQQVIIDSPLNCNMRVIAGAGTGKTTTISCRVRHMLDHTTPNKILVLTFNVDAKNNLIKSIKQTVGFDIKIDCMTIDSFSNKIIRLYDQANYQELDERCEVIKEYSKTLKEFGVRCNKLMKQYGEIISRQYKYVFFDEFQDVSRDQFMILKRMVTAGCYLTVIGDDSQNIYCFRGSNNYWIINLPTLLNRPTSTYMITTNYRSTQQIIDLANNSIKHNNTRLDKNMTGRFTGKKPKFILVESDVKMFQQIEQIINETKELCSLENLAIISRNSHYLKLIETYLEEKEIKYSACMQDNYSREFKKSVVKLDRLTLTTIHSSKGLEWSVVIFVGWADRHFPSNINNGLKNIEEERRLFYVGCKRSKTDLIFLAVKK